MEKKKKKGIDPNDYSVVPAGYGKLKIVYGKPRFDRSRKSVIVLRTPDLERMLNRKLRLSDCYYLNKIIKQQRNERPNKRSSGGRTQKS